MRLPGLELARQTPIEALASLRSSPQGISPVEAARRLAEFGPNSIQAAARQPLWLQLLKEFSHFFALILWLAAGLAFVAEGFEPAQGMLELGFAIVGVVVVN
ncbi:MAG TPA: cation-transporting P-type ATPase, partial [Rhodocyclaceae bacterium]|nr:cation-transporting P-type ATPase [Rhodocyclaceae bacterium]